MIQLKLTSLQSILIVCLLFGATSSGTARAGFIVDVVDTNLQVNSIGYVDVMITATGGDQDISTVLYHFRITDVDASPISSLVFIGAARPIGTSYVFDADRLNDVDAPIISFNDGVSLYGSDGTAMGQDVTVLNGMQKHLVRLQVQHTLQVGSDPADVVGNRFEIGLVDDPDSYFSNLNGDSIFDAGSFNPGTLTITAVPEPGSLVLVGSVLCGGLLMRYRKRTAPKTVVC